jgi:hypothetical protein
LGNKFLILNFVDAKRLLTEVAYAPTEGILYALGVLEGYFELFCPPCPRSLIPNPRSTLFPMLILVLALIVVAVVERKMVKEVVRSENIDEIWVLPEANRSESHDLGVS